jgi:hypothetical protein
MIENITDLFINKHGSFSKALQFETLVVIVGVLIFFNHYFKTNYGFVIILLAFALYIANNYIKIRQKVSTDFNIETLNKLAKLQQKSDEAINLKMEIFYNSQIDTNNISVARNALVGKSNLDSMYVDANIIHFLHSILPLADYNINEFYLLLQGTNNILQIKKEIDDFYAANGEYPSNTGELLENALELKTNTINNVHNFVYSIPKTKMTNLYLESVIERYSILISRVTDSVYKSYLHNIKKRGINTSTKFVTYDTTKPYDDTNLDKFKFYT